ncbi:MAG: hypothetical protein JXN60_05855 [Lentisphaerae bacterium]|nr:hypothetical protein [Lentisphaerota bacterium]
MKNKLAVLCGIFVIALKAGAATIYVDQSNTGGPWDGTTWATAFTNIADAVTELGVTNAVV